MPHSVISQNIGWDSWCRCLYCAVSCQDLSGHRDSKYGGLTLSTSLLFLLWVKMHTDPSVNHYCPCMMCSLLRYLISFFYQSLFTVPSALQCPKYTLKCHNKSQNRKEGKDLLWEFSLPWVFFFYVCLIAVHPTDGGPLFLSQAHCSEMLLRPFHCNVMYSLFKHFCSCVTVCTKCFLAYFS